jgi:hypothetical protein
MVTVTSQGRHRYYRLAGHRVAAAIEALSHLSPPAPVRGLRQSRRAATLAQARTCYDHLAGQAGVALLDALLAGGVLAGSTDGLPADGKDPAAGAAPQARQDLAVLEVTAAGEVTLAGFGVHVASLRHSRRRFAGACLDWTERRPHLNGALGAAITARLLELGWIERGARSRAVRITPAGQEGLAATFGLAGQPGSRTPVSLSGLRTTSMAAIRPPSTVNEMTDSTPSASRSTRPGAPLTVAIAIWRGGRRVSAV